MAVSRHVSLIPRSIQFYGEIKNPSYVFCLFTSVCLAGYVLHSYVCCWFIVRRTGKWHSSFKFKGYMLRCLLINIALNIGMRSSKALKHQVRQGMTPTRRGFVLPRVSHALQVNRLPTVVSPQLRKTALIHEG